MGNHRRAPLDIDWGLWFVLGLLTVCGLLAWWVPR
jgi:hypothetical protein